MEKVKNFFIKRKSSILHLLGSLGLLTISALIGIILGLNKANAVDKYVEEAIDYFQENNWTAFYNYAEVIDNDFINEVFFNDLAEKLYGEISGKDIVIDDILTEDNEAKVHISYKTTDGKSHELVLYFTKKDEKTYIFFPKWKLNIDKLIVRDSKFTVPTGFKVYVDGIELTNDNARITQNVETGMDTYVVPRLFEGEHVIYAQKEGVDVVEAQVSWTDNNSEYLLNTSELQVEQAQIDEVNSYAQNIVVGMYSAAFSESGITDISTYLKQDESTLAMVNAIYDGMLVAIRPDDGSTLNSMDFISFNYDMCEYTYPNQMDVKVSFECTFEARGKRNSKGGVREKYSGTSGSSITLRFIKEGDKWYCDKLDMTCIDYSKKEETQ